MTTFMWRYAALCGAAPIYLWAAPVQAQQQAEPEVATEVAPAPTQIQIETATPPRLVKLGYEGAYPPADTGNGRIPGTPYSVFRWAEDWREVSEKANRSLVDRLKDIPITDDLFSDGGVSLSLSGQGRLRHNFISSPGLRNTEDQHQILVRTVVGADLHLGDHVRVFGELANGILEGQNYGPVIGGFRNKLIVLQSFIDAWAPIPGGGVIGARYGRQEFADGPPPLVSVREIFNIHPTFNGIRAWVNWKHLRVDTFSFKTTRSGPGGTGDDIVNDRERFKGVNVGIVLANAPRREGDHLFLDPFFYDYRNEDQVVAGMLSVDHRRTFGARLWGNLGKVRIDWTVARQDGSVRNPSRNSDVDASAIFLDQGYTLPGPSRTEIGFHYYRGSGGGTYGTGTVKNFNYLFGNAPMLSNALFFSPANLQEFGPSFSLTPAPKIVLGGSYEFLSRVDESDAIYSAPGFAYAGTQNATGKNVGNLARLNFSWIVSPYAQVLVFAEHLNAGPVLTRAGFASANFLGSMIKVRF